MSEDFRTPYVKYVDRHFLLDFRRNFIHARKGKLSGLLDRFISLIEDDDEDLLRNLNQKVNNHLHRASSRQSSNTASQLTEAYDSVKLRCLKFADQYMEDLQFQIETKLHKAFRQIQRYFSMDKNPYSRVIRSVLRALLHYLNDPQLAAENRNNALQIEQIMNSILNFQQWCEQYNMIPLLQKLCAQGDTSSRQMALLYNMKTPPSVSRQILNKNNAGESQTAFS